MGLFFFFFLKNLLDFNHQVEDEWWSPLLKNCKHPLLCTWESDPNWWFGELLYNYCILDYLLVSYWLKAKIFKSRMIFGVENSSAESCIIALYSSELHVHLVILCRLGMLLLASLMLHRHLILMGTWSFLQKHHN